MEKNYEYKHYLIITMFSNVSFKVINIIGKVRTVVAHTTEQTLQSFIAEISNQL